MTDPTTEAPPAELIRAGTVNLARYMPETEARAVAIAAEIDSMELDLIGFQETEEWIERDLAKRLNGSWLVVSDHVNCPAFARADLFQRVAAANGQSWITITMPGSVRRRYGSAALLKRMSDGLVFVFATIHPSQGSESANSATDRIKQAESCWQHFVKWGVIDFPILLVGDMNARQMPPEGLPGVFVRHGMTDVLQYLKQKPRIDRAFVLGFTPLEATVNPVAGSASDHDFGVFVVQPGLPGPTPTPTPETALERLVRIHGPITAFRIGSFETARKEGYASRYTAAVQDWLGLEVTTRWTAADQTALDGWRHAEFPTWPPADYKGPVGPTSMTRLVAVAKAAGKKVYPVVK